MAGVPGHRRSTGLENSGHDKSKMGQHQTIVIAAGMLDHCGAVQNSIARGPSMTSGIAIHEGNAGQPTEIDAWLSRTLDRQISDRSTAIPKKTLRERLRRPLLILFPVLLAGVGAAYYLAEAPYVSTNDAFVRAAKESINARVAGQVIEIVV